MKFPLPAGPLKISGEFLESQSGRLRELMEDAAVLRRLYPALDDDSASPIPAIVALVTTTRELQEVSVSDVQEVNRLSRKLAVTYWHSRRGSSSSTNIGSERSGYSLPLPLNVKEEWDHHLDRLVTNFEMFYTRVLNWSEANEDLATSKTPDVTPTPQAALEIVHAERSRLLTSIAERVDEIRMLTKANVQDVLQARSLDVSWTAIGKAVGLTDQAARRRFDEEARQKNHTYNKPRDRTERRSKGRDFK